MKLKKEVENYDLLVMELYEKLIRIVNCLNPEEVNDIKRAFDWAKELHKNQKRKSGEPYIIHPLIVAFTMAKFYADKETIIAALLHDIVEDTDKNLKDIKKEFGTEVATLVWGVTNLDLSLFPDKMTQYLKNTRKTLESCKIDIRIILIKLADRTHNMKTIEFLKEENREKNAIETDEIYAPLAYGLGSYELKYLLEGYALKIRKPEIYFKIKRKIAEEQKKSKPTANKIIHHLEKELKTLYIPTNISIQPEKISKISRKTNLGSELDERKSFLYLNIVTEKIEDCYQILNKIQDKYETENTKDFIVQPKTNFHQSLQTQINLDELMLSVKIRTKEMKEFADLGILSFFKKDRKNAAQNMNKFVRQQNQFYQVVNLFNDIKSNELAVNFYKKELDPSHIYINVNNVIMEISQNTSLTGLVLLSGFPVDEVNVKVNNEFVPLNFELRNGDNLEIQGISPAIVQSRRRIG